MQSMVCAESLQKSYRGNEALKGISFTIEKGEIFALLGANGAGKTTTLECLEGLRRLDGGKAHVEGIMGVQLQSSSLPNGIRVSEAIRLFAGWRKTKPDWQAAARLGLSPILEKRYDTLSTGQKRRLHLALALLGDPEVLFLDEPTAGLDVEGRAALHEEIRCLKAAGKTIILASHDMAEVEELCDRLLILKDGKTAFIGPVAALTREAGKIFRVRVTLSEELPEACLPQTVRPAENGEKMLYILDDLEQGLRDLLEALRKEGVRLLDLQVERPSLEERFLEIAKEEAR